MQTMTRQELNAMVGRTLVGAGGEKIGKITDVYVDQRSRQPEWLSVSTGMFGSKVSFVPLSGVRRGAGEEFRAAFDKDLVKEAPTAEAEGHLTEAEEDRLYRHYGIAAPTYSQAGTPTPARAGDRPTPTTP